MEGYKDNLPLAFPDQLAELNNSKILGDTLDTLRDTIIVKDSTRTAQHKASNEHSSIIQTQ